jgi:ATP-dependent DNA ligase
VVAAFRFGKEEGTLGSLILGMYDDDGQLHIVGHTSGFKAKEKRELLEKLEPYRTHERGSGEASRWKSTRSSSGRACARAGVRSGVRSHNRTADPPWSQAARWRDDKDPTECDISQLRS